VLDAYAVERDASPPGCERVYAVVGDGDQSSPKAELGGQLACTGPELITSVRSRAGWSRRRSQRARVVRRARAGSACALISSWSVAPGRARSSSSSASSGRSSLGVPSRWRNRPTRDLRRGALVGPAGQRRDDFEQRVVQQHELADGGQAAVRLEAVEWPLKRARVSAAADESGP